MPSTNDAPINPSDHRPTPAASSSAPVLGVGQGTSSAFVSHNLIYPIRCPTIGVHLTLRQQHFARPLLRLRWLATTVQNRVLPKSGLGQACAYLLGHWEPLTAHLRHSHTKLDTNSVENAIRPSKLGAKNWLFVGHPDAGDRAAVIYSLVVSCQRYGHNPHAYLRDVLGRLPAMTTADDLHPLLPSQWQPPTTAVS